MNAFTYTIRSARKFLVLTGLVLALGLGSANAVHAQAIKPALNIVAVGISDYRDLPKLKVAHKDAIDAAELFQAQQGKLFGEVRTTKLLDADATVANIIDAVERARAQATADSYTVLYLAGHGGKGPNPEYAYCAYDKDLRWSQIQSSLRRFPGKVIVVLDTCEAGSANGGDNLIVFCGSLAHEGGQEDQVPTGNGFFTKIFLRGLSGGADANGDGTVTLEEVNAYVTGRLTQLSNGTQHHMLLQPASVSGSLPLTQVAPVAGFVPVAQVGN